MREQLLEQMLAGLVVLGYASLTLVLGIAGIALEYRSYLFLEAGETTVALWMLAMGIVFLVFAVRLATDKLLPAYEHLV